MLYDPEFVEQVTQGPQWMLQRHFGTRVSHDVLCVFPLLYLVTVNRTFCTGGLCLAVRTFLEPAFRVLHKLGAIAAHSLTCPAFPGVMVTAVDRRHATKRLQFTGKSAFQPGRTCVLRVDRPRHTSQIRELMNVSE